MFESARVIDTLFIVIIKININGRKETTIGVIMSVLVTANHGTIKSAPNKKAKY